MKDKASKTKGLAWLAAAIALASILALGISPLVRAIPWSWEQRIALLLDSSPPEKLCRGSPQADALLRKLLDRLYPLDRDDAAIAIHVQIVDVPEVNAYAGLGGKITINAGFLEAAESAEEVAGVLAHEIEHVHKRHILESVLIHLMTVEGLRMISSGDLSSGAEWANFFLSMSFSRVQEAAADEGGLLRLQKAHVDNQGFKHFFERMKRSQSVPVYISDHPSDQDRFKMVEKFQNRDTQPILSHEEWLVLQKYCQ